uniref:Uncharacterized protein n=1 Tax=Denticeps clupeoides TaxID=299321 RepID=A0AAY4AUW9_9TELE
LNSTSLSPGKMNVPLALTAHSQQRWLFYYTDALCYRIRHSPVSSEIAKGRWSVSRKCSPRTQIQSSAS